MRLVLLIPLVALSACSTPSFRGLFGDAPPVTTTAPAAAPVLTAAPPPPETARTVDEFDTTSAVDRALAVATEVSAEEVVLGTTLATLGPPTEPGIWLKTPLVDSVIPGRITYQEQTINVELRPSGGAEGSGSQISLAAMRLLEAPLTGILELQVTATDG